MAAGGLGRSDEAGAQFIEIAGMGEYSSDLLVGDFFRQTVGAEQDDVSLLQRKLGYVRRDRGLGADGAGNDVAQRRVIGFVLGELAKTHLFIDERVIEGLPGQLSVAKEVASAVADIADEPTVTAYGQRHQGGSHAMQCGVFCGARVHALVGIGNGLFEHLAAVLLRTGRAEALNERVHGDAAGDFAGGCSAHSIAESEDALFDTVAKSVFVGGADLTHIGAASGFKIKHSSNIRKAGFLNSLFYRPGALFKRYMSRVVFARTSVAAFCCHVHIYPVRLIGSMPKFSAIRLLLMGIAVVTCLVRFAHAGECSVAQPHPLTEEQLALIRGDLTQAETLYRQKAAQQPKNYELTAGLVRALIAEQKVDEADSTAKAALGKAPQSVELLTALAEVQYRQGFPWDEEKTLNTALQADPCYARLHLALAIYYRFNSYYASALREIKTAHQLDPYNADIRRAWVPTQPLKERIAELKAYLAAKDTDVDSLRRAQYELAVLENLADNQGSGCQLASSVTTTEIPFTAIMVDAQRIRGWGLDVYFNDHKSRLQVDTGASGLYVSRPVAEHAGLKPISRSEASGIGDKGTQGGYIARADSIKIGGLEFKNCLVQVSDRRNVVDVDGLIGMDVFSNFLVTLDFPWRKLTLGPLPLYPGTAAVAPSLSTGEEDPSGDSDETAAPAKDATSTPATGPHDRYVAPEMQKWTSVYRVGHNMIVPTALNNKRMRLFIIDTGAQSTSISPSAAREVTKVFSSDASVKGVSGNVSNVYLGNSVTFRFAHIQQEHPNVLSFDTSGFSRNIGTEISGFIGFDMLGLLVVKIDYRDGLMSFEYSADRGYQHLR